jgi:mRNA-degrading endonuclease RelE of RelBE toxin-antitoxin system
MTYQLIIPNSVAKDIKRLDKPVQRALRSDHFPLIKENP